MAQQQIAGAAVLVALAFMLLALAACANSGHGPANIAPIAAAPGAPEFHDAAIGGDTLRSRLRAE